MKKSRFTGCRSFVIELVAAKTAKTQRTPRRKESVYFFLISTLLLRDLGVLAVRL
jgi:hypothetical protein